MAISNVSLSRVNPITSSISSTGKNLQNQISTKEQHLNRLTSDSKLSIAEKEKARQQIQKEIDELNRKLELTRMRQEDAEKAATQKQEKETTLKEDTVKKGSTNGQSSDSSNVTEDKAKAKPINLSASDVQKMFYANHVVHEKSTQENIVSRIENNQNVLNAEIQQDKLYGSDTTSKKEALTAMREMENFWLDAKTQMQTKEVSASSGISPKAKVIISDQI